MPPKVRLRIDPETLDRARSTVAAIQQVDPSLSLNQFVNEAIEARCQAMEQEHNRGRKFPKGRLAAGRRPAG